MLGALNFLLYLLLTVFMLGILIFVHELGHFLTARACRVPIREFSIGMGKRIGGFTSKKTGTMYSLRLLPIGGYVSMSGENEDEGDPNDFVRKNVFQRILILAAGAGMNILVGFTVMIVLTGGMMLAGHGLPSTQIGAFDPGAPSYVSGLEPGDTVLRVGGARVHTGYELSYEILNSGHKPVDMTVLRDGKKTLVPNVRFQTQESQGVTFGVMDFRVTPMKRSVGNILKASLFRSVSTIKMTFDSLRGIVTGRYSLKSLSGPIGISSAVSEVAAMPMPGWNILYLFAVMAMSIGVMNLMPIPALDGGRLFFRVVEILRFGRPVNSALEARIHSAGMVVLMVLMAAIACKDIFNLF